MASGWDAKNVAGRPFILMGPTNNEAVYLRFIESVKFDKNFRSLKTYGWNAIEILVKDTEQLFLKLKDSQYFRIVGEPVYISDEKSIKAMQVLGPSNELIYFTSIEKPEITQQPHNCFPYWSPIGALYRELGGGILDDAAGRRLLGSFGLDWAQL